MAFKNDRYYLLGQFNQSIDGVSFKINERSLPPKSIVLPISYKPPSDPHESEYTYDYQLEHSTITQYESYQSSKKEKLRKKIEKKEKAEALEEEKLDNDNYHSDNNAQVKICEVKSDEPLRSIDLSNRILKPTPLPLSANHQSSADPAGPSPFRLSDFEREADPFESAELQVLNDKEELNKILTNDAIINGSSQQTKLTNSLTGPANVITDKSIKNIEYPNMDETSNSHVLLKSGENRVNYKNTEISKNPFLSNTNPFIASSSNHMKAQSSEVSKPIQYTPLPPIAASLETKTPNKESFPNHNNPFVSHNKCEVISPAFTQYSSQRCNGVSLHENLSDHSSEKFPTNFNDESSLQGSSSFSANSKSSLKSALSTPELRNSENPDQTQLSCSLVLHSRSHTPPSRPSSNQEWNPFTPLPPPNISSNRTANQQLNTNKSMVESNLSEHRELIKHVTNMGFSQNRVSNAVKIIGPNDKKVVDYLCLVNKLMEKQYSLSESEDAVLTIKDNQDKMIKYINLSKQFKEFGFSKDLIKDALLKSDLDEHKALDILTNCDK